MDILIRINPIGAGVLGRLDWLGWWSADIEFSGRNDDEKGTDLGLGGVGIGGRGPWWSMLSHRRGDNLMVAG